MADYNKPFKKDFNGSSGFGKQNQGKRPNNYVKPEIVNMDDYYALVVGKGYYQDAEKKKLDPDFIIKYARSMANNIDAEGNATKNKRTQIRKYYDFLIRVEEKLRRCKMDYSYVEADVSELVPKVVYAKSRNVVSDAFVEFIERNTEAVHDAADFKAFLKHFEAIVAYMKKDK